MREWKLVSQDVTLRVIKHCVRCKTPNFNKSKGVTNESNEPLKTLTNYKLHPMIGVVFGQYLSADKDCEIKIGKFNSLNHMHFYRWQNKVYKEDQRTHRICQNNIIHFYCVSIK